MSYVTDRCDDRLVEILKRGGVGLLPSDTIYGLSCRALDRKAVERVHHLKGRDQTKPYIVLIADTTQLSDLGLITTDFAPAFRYWPGKLTFVSSAEDAPEWLRLKTNSLAVRQPKAEALRALISKTGPIISTSANKSGQRPVTTVGAARRYFADKLDFYVDIGRLRGQPSTIIRKNNYKYEVLRQGAVKFKEA